MERTTEDKSLTAIAERAAEWFVAYREGNMTASERSEFVAWLQASPLHVREYLSVAEMAHVLGESAVLTDVELVQLLNAAASESVAAVNVVPLNSYRPQPMVVPEQRRYWPAALAACLVLAVGLILLARWPGWHGVFGAEQYQVAGDGQGVWRLSDGSVLHLNSNSAVRISFSSVERLVELQRGQAMFEVSHHSPLKFRVRAGFADVTALGTRFEVRRDDQANQITVVEGRVSVQANPALANDEANNLAAIVAVNAGQRLLVNADGSVTQPEKADASQVFAWVKHPVEFEQQSLASVVQEINRYALTPITIENSSLAQLPISGVFNAYDTESFIEFLRRLPGVEVMTGSDRVQVVRRAGMNQPV